MSDYISREAARPDAFCVGTSCQECPFCKDNLNGGCRVDDFIMALPTADVAPVVHGRWEYNPGDNIPYCSECMMPQDTECNYCPDCGAKMDGEAKE